MSFVALARQRGEIGLNFVTPRFSGCVFSNYHSPANFETKSVVDKYLDSPDIDPIENVDQENKRGRRESGDR